MLAPAVTKRLIDVFAEQHSADARAARERLAMVTDRETAVVHAVARGLSNTEIARELAMSEATVRAHVSRSLANSDSATASRSPSWSETPATASHAMIADTGEPDSHTPHAPANSARALLAAILARHIQ